MTHAGCRPIPRFLGDFAKFLLRIFLATNSRVEITQHLEGYQNAIIASFDAILRQLCLNYSIFSVLCHIAFYCVLL